MQLSFLVLKASRNLKNGLEKELQVYDVTAAQFAVIQRVSMASGGITAAEIAEGMGSDRPTISGIVNRLVAKDILVKEDNPKDGRSSFLRIHEGAEGLVQKLMVESEQVNSAGFSVFSQAELLQFESYLLRLIQQTEEAQ